jgi:hypothetical protein
VSAKTLLRPYNSNGAYPRVRGDEFFGLTFGAGAWGFFARTALVFGVLVIVVVSCVEAGSFTIAVDDELM